MHDHDSGMRTDFPILKRKDTNAKAIRQVASSLISLNLLILILVGISCYKQLNNAVCEVSGVSMQNMLSRINSGGLGTKTSEVPSIAISEISVLDKGDDNCVSGPLAMSDTQLDELVYKREHHFDSNRYWEDRYKSGFNSGAGSYGEARDWKANHVNKYVKENNIQSVLEFGFGDGSQLSVAKYPQYAGVDVSRTIYKATRDKFKGDSTKQFFHTSDPIAPFLSAEMTMSLDVLFHLVDRPIFVDYVNTLFSRARKHVAIYSCDVDDDHAEHVLFRTFTPYVATAFPEFELVFHEKNPKTDNDCAGIYFFQRR